MSTTPETLAGVQDTSLSVVEDLMDLTGAKFATFWMRDGDDLVPSAMKGPGSEAIRSIATRLPFTQETAKSFLGVGPLLGRKDDPALTENSIQRLVEGLGISDVLLRALTRALFAAGMRSIAIVSVAVDEEFIGMLAIAGEDVSDQTVRFLEAIATQLGIDLSSRRRLEEARERAVHLESLMKASSLLARSLELPAVLESIVASAAGQVDATHGAVFLLNVEK